MSSLTGLKDGGVAVFDKQEAQQIIEKVRVPHVRFALERVAIDDLPRLSVTKMTGNRQRR